jgi:hypothetical protein
MHDGARLMFVKHRLQCLVIPNVDLLEDMTRVRRDSIQILEVAGIGQSIDRYDRLVAYIDEMADQCRSDKTRAAAYQNCHLPTCYL